MLTWFDGEWMVICTRGHMIIFQNATSFFAATVWRMVVWASGGCKRRLLSPWFGTKNTSFQKFPFLWAILIEVRNLCGIFWGPSKLAWIYLTPSLGSRSMIAEIEGLLWYHHSTTSGAINLSITLSLFFSFFRFISQNCVNCEDLAGIVSGCLPQGCLEYHIADASSNGIRLSLLFHPPSLMFFSWIYGRHRVITVSNFFILPKAS